MIVATRQSSKKPALSLRREEMLWAYVLILPSVLGVLVFGILPIIGSFFVSLTDWHGLSAPNFVGLENYAEAVQDQKAINSTLRTLYFTLLASPLGLAVSLLLATLIHNLARGWLKTLFRTIYYLPMVTVGVAVALVWQTLLGSQNIANVIAHPLGLEAPNWLTSPQWVLPTIAVVTVWQSAGASIILFLAALANVPKELYEAAQLDGAKAWTAFRFVTLPMISPTIFLVLILSLINNLQIFTEVLIMTKGGLGENASTIAIYVYKAAFNFFKMGYASALAWLLGAILIGLIVLQWRLQQRWVNYDAT